MTTTRSDLIGAEQHLFTESTLAILVVDSDGIITNRLDRDYPDNFLGFDAAELRVFSNSF